MRIRYDAEADRAYVFLADHVEPGDAVEQRFCDVHAADAGVVLDFDRDQRLIGLEVLGASRVLHPESLRDQASEPEPD